MRAFKTRARVDVRRVVSRWRSNIPLVIEHLKAKEAFGELTYELVNVDTEGLVRVDDVMKAVDDDTCLVTP